MMTKKSRQSEYFSYNNKPPCSFPWEVFVRYSDMSTYCMLATLLGLREAKGELFQDSASQELETK